MYEKSVRYFEHSKERMLFLYIFLGIFLGKFLAVFLALKRAHTLLSAQNINKNIGNFLGIKISIFLVSRRLK